MLIIDVRHDIANLVRGLDDLQRRHLPFATAKALTKTAQLAREAEYDEMRRVFDRPTPFTLKSLYLKAAKPRELFAEIWFKPTQANEHYLVPQIYGGERETKRFEQALRNVLLLPPDLYAVPGAAAKLDAYGNMSRGQLVQILSALRAAQMTSGYLANRTPASIKRAGKRKLPEFFVGRPGGGKLPLGVWQRFRFAHGSAVKPVLMFVRKPRYSKRFDFFGVGRRVLDREFLKQFAAALESALAGGH